MTNSENERETTPRFLFRFEWGTGPRGLSGHTPIREVDFFSTGERDCIWQRIDSTGCAADCSLGIFLSKIETGRRRAVGEFAVFVAEKKLDVAIAPGWQKKIGWD